MNWILLSVCSAILLGFYEIAKKAALRDNAVPVVLFLHVVISATAWAPMIVASSRSADRLPELLRVDALTASDHGLIAAKALLAGTSWVLASYALKHLPMSIASPIRASSPVWTILIAVLFMGERPNAWQWVGVSVIVVSFYAFSLVGRTEGIHFHRDRWVLFMIAGTLLGALSALYDKYLLQTMHMRAATVQAWFSVYLTIVMLPLFIRWFVQDRNALRFEWRWSIPMIAILLLASDFIYFTAIEQPGAMISLVSPVRRTSVVIPFLVGITLFGEKNWRPKAFCITSLLIGVWVLSLNRA